MAHIGWGTLSIYSFTCVCVLRSDLPFIMDVTCSAIQFWLLVVLHCNAIAAVTALSQSRALASQQLTNRRLLTCNIEGLQSIGSQNLRLLEFINKHASCHADTTCKTRVQFSIKS